MWVDFNLGSCCSLLLPRSAFCFCCNSPETMYSHFSCASSLQFSSQSSIGLLQSTAEGSLISLQKTSCKDRTRNIIGGFNTLEWRQGRFLSDSKLLLSKSSRKDHTSLPSSLSHQSNSIYGPLLQSKTAVQGLRTLESAKGFEKPLTNREIEIKNSKG